MKLVSLNITNHSWRDKFPYTGKVTFKTEDEVNDALIELKLEESDVDQIVAYCAEMIVNATKRVANELATEMLSHRLEHKPEIPVTDSDTEEELLF